VRRAADRAKVTIETTIPDRLPLIFCDENQIIEALLNMLMNAIEAMTGGGTLTVCASATAIGDGDPDLIDITIADSGPGMSRAELARVFERYYTTKASGTGLGLAIVQRIINSYEGTVNASSEPGIGTTLRVQLPVR
jgi:signal transduction histidine kinase